MTHARGLSLFLCLSLFWLLPATAAELQLPNGSLQTVERVTSPDGFDAPIGPFDGAIVPTRALEGAVSRRAWRVPVAGLTPLQVMVPLREQLEEQGYDVAFECAAKTCGGFDFRFAVEVLPGPNMYVNISSYRYLTAFQGGVEAPSDAVSVLVSVTSAASYVQIIEASIDVEENLVTRPPSKDEAPSIDTPTTNSTTIPVDADGVADRLLEDGFTILTDLEFATGTSELGAGPYPTLERLANLLKEQEGLRIALVGHTDTVGGLEPNIALSRNRARAVRQRLVQEYGVSETRLDAEGMGYLSPVASNATPEGRERNRRVEAVLLGATN